MFQRCNLPKICTVSRQYSSKLAFSRSFAVSRAIGNEHKAAESITQSLLNAKNNIKFEYANHLRVLDPATNALARRLTANKYSPADFVPRLDPVTGKYHKARYSARVLADLRKGALVCGLDPELDLNLPKPEPRKEVAYVRKKEAAKQKRSEERRAEIAARVAVMDKKIENWRRRRLNNRNRYRTRMPF